MRNMSLITLTVEQCTSIQLEKTLRRTEFLLINESLDRGKSKRA